MMNAELQADVPFDLETVIRLWGPRGGYAGNRNVKKRRH